MSALPIKTNHTFIFQNKTFSGISWKTSENPTHWTIALHGFGRSPLDFEKFARELGPNKGLLAISFFAHNDSDFFSKEETEKGWPVEVWKDQLTYLLQELRVTKCALLCYSLGGRLGLKWIELSPEKITSAQFFAPDGLIRNRLYRFTVSTKIGHWLAQKIVQNPTSILGLAKLLNSLRLLPKKLLNFVEYHLASEEIRKQVFNVWMGYRHCYPNLNIVAKNLKQFEIPTEFIFGKYDAIIPWQHGNKLRKLTKDNARVQWKQIEKGHKIL
jgi:pimeloyl-ACP methyl ester carboxylesterase